MNLDPELSEENAEKFQVKLEMRYVEPIPRLKGDVIEFAELKSPLSIEFANMHGILNDISYALECFRSAWELGIPEASNFRIKLLIQSGILSYTRPFTKNIKHGITKDGLKAICPSFDEEVHDYISALRSKHIAHPVNEFESYKPVAAVAYSSGRWENAGAVGVSQRYVLGVSKRILLHIITHCEGIEQSITAKIEKLRIEVYEEFRNAFENNGAWERLPLDLPPHRGNVNERR